MQHKFRPCKRLCVAPPLLASPRAGATAPLARRPAMSACAEGSLFLSSDVNLNVKLLLLNLHGSIPEPAAADGPPLPYADGLERASGAASADLYLSCQLYAHGGPLGLPERTCNAPGSRLRWNEWLTFRAKYCDLSADAHVAISLIGSSAPREARVLGHACLPLFDPSQRLSAGRQRVRCAVMQGCLLCF